MGFIQWGGRNSSSVVPNGIVGQQHVLLDWSDASRSLVVRSVGGVTFQVVSGRTTRVFDGEETIQIQDIEGLWYFKFDENGDLVANQEPFDIMLEAPIASLYWDADAKKALSLTYEAHSNAVDDATQRYLRSVIGFRWASGLTLSSNAHNSKTTQPPDADGRNTQFSLSPGRIIDEDLSILIQDTAATLDYSQELGTFPFPNATPEASDAAWVPNWYAIGTSDDPKWRKTNASVYPFRVSGQAPLVPSYNPDTTVWSEVTPTNGRVFVVWVCASSQLGWDASDHGPYEPVFAITHPGTYRDLAEVRDLCQPDDMLDDRDRPFLPAVKILYRLAYHYSTAYPAGCMRAKLLDATDFRQYTAKPIQNFEAVSHDSLRGLDKINQHPATSIDFTQTGWIPDTDLQEAVSLASTVPNWSMATTWFAGQTAVYDGILYRAKETHSNRVTSPSADTDYWESLGAPARAGSAYPVVSVYADLPNANTVIGEVYLVSTATGIWPFGRKDKGFYRSDGVNWNYLGTTPDFYRDDNFQIFDGADANRAMRFSLDGVTPGQVRILTVPDVSGTLALDVKTDGTLNRTDGKLSSISLSNGQTTTFVRDGDGKITEIQKSDRTITLLRENGKISGWEVS